VRPPRPGKAYLVGAGPGDPLLLTLRALDLIRGADVVIYDRLVSKEVLRLIPRGVRKIYAGKAPGAGASSQRRLNQLILEEAGNGRMVVRLKGGDPFVFSRGGEEAEFLIQHGIEVEVVPGITSAIGVPAYAGIPLTHRDYSSSVAIVTGHSARRKRAANRLMELAGGAVVDTVVILMGVTTLQGVSRGAMRRGLPPSTPMAVIQWGTTKRQKTLLLTLREAASGYHLGIVESPSVIVIGRTVTLAGKLVSKPRGRMIFSPGYLSAFGK
jgi:uroporphyrin-III C-methyltransferase